MSTSSNLLTGEQTDRLYSPSWSEGEIDLYLVRVARLMRLGHPEPEAEHLAERLVLRDRDFDDRRVCAECRYGSSRCCPAGTPLPDVMQRCRAFTEAP